MRRRTIQLTTGALAALLAAGCGGARTAAQPRLPRTLATELAAESDGVAAALRSGDVCGAHVRATALQHRTIRVVNARTVPPGLQDQLMSGVNALAAAVPACEVHVTVTHAPAVTNAQPSPPPKHGKAKGKKHHGHGHGHEEKHGKKGGDD